MDDQPRPAATNPDSEHSLSIEDAFALYERAGLPRTPRTIQRYCEKGHLDCRRVEIPYGEKYLIAPASVSKHIAYIEETRQTLAGRDTPRPAAAASPPVTLVPQPQAAAPDEARPTATDRDMPRQAEAGDAAASRYLARLEGENEFLRGQITVKDEQIKDLTERARETNHLIAGLQKMLTPLLGRPAANERARGYAVDPPIADSMPGSTAGDNSEPRP